MYGVTKQKARGQSPKVFFIAIAMHSVFVLYNLDGYARGKRNAEPKFYYPISDWLINYQGGFVRRGLSGEVIFHLAQVTGTPGHVWAILIGSGLTLSVVVLISIHLFRIVRDVDWLPAACLCFCPLLIGFYALDDTTFLRKECLFVLLTELHLRIAAPIFRNDLESTDRRPYLIKTCLLFSLVGIPCALIHESFLFIGLPTNIAITWLVLSKQQVEKRPWQALSYFAPAILACLTAAAVPSNQITVASICNSWARVREDFACGYGPRHAIRYLASSFIDALGIGALTIRRDGFIWAVLSLLMVPPFVIALRSYRERRIWLPNRNAIQPLNPEAVLLGFPFLASIPLFLMTYDWGRWISVICIMFLQCTTLLTDHTSANLGPTPARRLHTSAMTLSLLVSLFFRLPCTYAYLPKTCTQGILVHVKSIIQGK